MTRTRDPHRLRIELLRARAAVDRVDLALALSDIGHGVDSLRRGGRIAATVARTLAAGFGRARSGWSVARFVLRLGAALLGLRWLRRRRPSRQGR